MDMRRLRAGLIKLELARRTVARLDRTHAQIPLLLDALNATRAQDEQETNDSSLVTCYKLPLPQVETINLQLEQLFQDYKNVEVDTNEEAFYINNNPMLNTVVIETLLKKLDFYSILTFRLVCKDWNDIALGILSQKSKIHLPSPPQDTDGQTFKKTKENFLKTFLAPPTPSLLLSNFIIADSMLNLDIFQDLGKIMKSLTLSFKALPDLTKIQVILANHCQNLKTLTLIQDPIETQPPTVPEPPETDLQNFLDTILKHDLSLCELTLEINSTNSVSLVKAFIAMAKAAPNLTSIKGKFSGTTLISTFFEELQKAPATVQKLTNLTIQGTSYRINTLISTQLSELPLGPTLKTLCVQPYSNSNEEEFSKMIQKVAPTLEELVIRRKPAPKCGKFSILEFIELLRANEASSEPNQEQGVQFPVKMERLKVFKNYGPLIDDYFIKSFDCLAKMPKLEELFIECHNPRQNEEESEFKGSQIDLMIFKTVGLSSMPNMKVLTINGKLNMLSSMDFLENFPNLEKFSVELGSGDRDRVRNPRDGKLKETHPSKWNLMAVEAILMKANKLKKLMITFMASNCITQLQKSFNKMFSENLKNMTGLETLILKSGIKTGNRQTVLDANMGKAFTQAPSLRFVELHGYSVLPETMDDFCAPFIEKQIQLELC